MIWSEMDALIGLDLGTSAVKGIIVSTKGRRLGQAAQPVEFLRPGEGRVEIDPEEHYRNVCRLIAGLVSGAPAGTVVRGLGMAAASGNTILTGAGGEPLTNIISWLDQRAMGSTNDILPGFDTEGVPETVGWPWTECFPFAMIAWFRKHQPDVFGRAGHVGMNTDYLLYRLTGRWGMDYSTATTFYLQHQRSRSWHRPYLDLLGLREDQLCPLLPSGSPLGPLTETAARDCGLTTQTVVSTGAFDHPCAARGTGVFEPGDLLLSCGTSWVGFYPIADRALGRQDRLLTDPFMSPAGPWGCMFSLPRVGVTFDACIDACIAPGEEDRAERYRRFNQASADCAAGAHGLFVNPLDPPSMDELRTYDAGDVARAIMEGAAFEMRTRIADLAKLGIPAARIVMVGGPSESPIWPQIVSDVTGLQLELLNGQTAGALGAAILAGVAGGLFADEREGFEAVGGTGRMIAPSDGERKRYEELYQGYREAQG